MDLDFPLILSWAVIISGVDLACRRGVVANRAASGLREAYRARRRGAVRTTKRSMQILKEPMLIEYARSFFPVLLLVLVLRSFLVEPYQIPSESMVPTLEVGDFILVNKYAYGIRLPVLGTKLFDVGEPQRGDVMVFIPPHEPRYFIKRVDWRTRRSRALSGQSAVHQRRAQFRKSSSIRWRLTGRPYISDLR